jgi:BirA family biotin operon repressor/biotin-[acetyl-CoA-carboxylase] ligase
LVEGDNAFWVVWPVLVLTVLDDARCRDTGCMTDPLRHDPLRSGPLSSGVPRPDRPPLDPDALAEVLLSPRGPLARLDVVERSGSTNSDLAAAARATPAAYPTPALLTADHQDAGRGRAGRTWQTPPRAALTSSLLVEADVPAHRLPWLPLLAGLGVVRGLREVAGLEAVLKWPNDVLLPAPGGTDLDGWGPYRKAVGILVEALPAVAGPAAPGSAPVTSPSGDAAFAPTRVVVGFGINVTQSADELPVPSATSLALAGSATTDRAVVLDAVVRDLVAVLDSWEAADGDARAARLAGGSLAGAVEEACVSVGARVAVDLVDGTTLTGDAYGLGAGGELLVRSDDGREHVVVSGDVRHVRAGGTASLGA